MARRARFTAQLPPSKQHPALVQAVREETDERGISVADLLREVLAPRYELAPDGSPRGEEVGARAQ